MTGRKVSIGFRKSRPEGRDFFAAKFIRRKRRATSRQGEIMMAATVIKIP